MAKWILIPVVAVAALIVIASAAAGVAYAVGRGSGDVIREERSLSGFERVELSGIGNLIITQGEKEGLAIEADEEIVERLETRVEDGTLKIGPRSPWNTFGFVWMGKDINLYVSVKNLSAVKVSGSGSIRSDGTIKTGDLRVTTSGSSDVDLDVKAQSVVAKASGAADMTLSGVADRLQLESSGSSGIDARHLASATVAVRCSGSCDAVVNASRQLQVRVSGSGTVAYVGTPTVELNTSGSGKVVKQAE